MRKGYTGFYSAKKELTSISSDEPKLDASRSLLSDRLLPGKYKKCKVTLKEAGFKGYFTIGFMHTLGRHVEHVQFKDAEYFTLYSLWDLVLEEVGSVSIKKAEGDWVVMDDNTTLFTGPNYSSCKGYVMANRLEIKKVVIKDAQLVQY